MIRKLSSRLKIYFGRFSFIPKYFLIIPFLMLVAALIIRLSTGGTHLIYNALDGRGIFPGPFMYTLLYFLRIILFSVVLAFCLFSYRTYNERFRTVIPVVIAAVMLLLEYKMIFGGVSLILAMIFAALTGFFVVFAVITLRIKYRSISTVMLVFALFQLLHFIQLISLSVCL